MGLFILIPTGKICKKCEKNLHPKYFLTSSSLKRQFAFLASQYPFIIFITPLSASTTFIISRTLKSFNMGPISNLPNDYLKEIGKKEDCLAEDQLIYTIQWGTSEKRK
ncbi:MAG: hypothetical protein ACFFAJ_06735 [Candidatus Hodarchaeota archaeon]